MTQKTWRKRIEHFFYDIWYGVNQPPYAWHIVLRCLSWVFAGIVRLRRWYYGQKKLASQPRVVVVGNFTVGGSGKTPVLIELVHALKNMPTFIQPEEKGITAKVGVLTRGYGSGQQQPIHLPVRTHVPSPNITAQQVGDEACLIWQKTQVDVVVDHNRVRGLATLAAMGMDWVLCDDGLQHLAMPRHFEMALVQTLGNGQLLPAGPLREPLRPVDMVLYTGADMDADLMHTLRACNTHVYHAHRKIIGMLHAQTGEMYELNAAHTHIQTGKIAFLCGIAHPSLFQKMMAKHGFYGDMHALPDHANASMLCQQLHGLTQRYAHVIITEKDWVKIQIHHLPPHGHLWVTVLQMVLPAEVVRGIQEHFNQAF